MGSLSVRLMVSVFFYVCHLFSLLVFLVICCENVVCWGGGDLDNQGGDRHVCNPGASIRCMFG